ncbi:MULTISPECIES: phosphoribosyltransferase [Gordonia]|uniref:Erythromycin esterase n=1 Tax=Gordonia terrae C-6 TaxID=1316928 RepID=R7Y7J1_9ACTN|nr:MULTISPECIES: phosphoribosyltransferase family protein [Gordonia]AFR50849.1 putative phosphoribosyltransferase [Gordonia sp. KTR9]EON31649.1 erythromycin esterase [Gordonia terrae C-6]
MRPRTFADRREAGRLLGARVVAVLNTAATPVSAPVVLGLARGGVPVAREVADAISRATGRCGLDVLVVRKIGAPGHEEFAMGALTAHHLVVNDDVPRRLGVSRTGFEESADRERRVLRDRERRYRGDRPEAELSHRTVILVDDGLATGSSMAVAVDSVRAAGAAHVVVAAPTAPSDSVRRLQDRGVDEVVVLVMPEPFRAVGLSYEDFTQVDDDEVVAALDRSGG